jgi:hypothetical protein
MTVFILLSLGALPTSAGDIRILTPYFGYISNVYDNEEQDLELVDGGPLGGLFFQWINPDLYQWNIFLYHAPDVNYSVLWGGHLIFDYYFGVQDAGKWVVGGGLEVIRLDMDAGDEIEGADNFTLLNNIYVPFARIGRYFYFSYDPVHVSILPWVGFQPEFVRGDFAFEKIASDEVFAVAGLNMKATIFRFVEVEAKYKITFNPEQNLSAVSGLLNVFVNRNIGISYRMRYFETTVGSNLYHIGGIAVMF